MQPASSENERSILVLDDDPDFLNEIRLMLVSNGMKEVATLADSTELLATLERGGVAVLLMDWMMPVLSGAELLPIIVQRFPHVPVIIMTAVNDLQTVVGCIKEGAFDYITKPIDVNRLLSCINKALQISELANQNRRLKEYLLGDELLRPEVFSEIVTVNPRMQAIFKIVETMGATRHPVLITGETGVGKELIARAIHRSSGLRGAFVPLNVAGLDDMMIADTLFGHKKGAFTGAHEPREGLIAKADGGTLFLDEIGDLGTESQVKLLRLLQEHEYYRLGSDALIKSNARIIAASNQDFESLMERGEFRRDLYHRLRNHHIHIPPLRERREDIPLLIGRYLNEAAAETGREVPLLTREARNALENYRYPGNVRELIHLVQQAVTCNSSGVLKLEDFPVVDPCNDPCGQSLRVFRDRAFKLQLSFPAFPSMEAVEQMLIEEAVRMTDGNKSQAAELLGISRPTLNRKLSEAESRAAGVGQ